MLNVVAQGHKSLLTHFGHGFEPGRLAFEGIEIVRSPRDVPVIAAALGYLECTPIKHFDSGDHRIYLARRARRALRRSAAHEPRPQIGNALLTHAKAQKCVVTRNTINSVILLSSCALSFAVRPCFHSRS